MLAGDIDMVVSDHSPCTPDLKLPGEKDFMAAWGGISSLQFGNYKSLHCTNIQPSKHTLVGRFVAVLEPGRGPELDSADDEPSPVPGTSEARQAGTLQR